MSNYGSERRLYYSSDSIPAAKGGVGDTDKSMRENLRVPLSAELYLFPTDNSWRGRRKVACYDISCGGIAFFSEISYRAGETLEILIPITSKPLLVQGSVIRQELFEDGRTLYAAKYINICEGEEAMIREAVFSTQLKQRRQH